MVCKSIIFVGFIIFVVIFNVVVCYFFVFLFVGFFFGINNIFFGWVFVIVGQIDEKKVVLFVIVNSLGNCVFIYMLYFWLKSYGDCYIVVWSVSIVFLGGVIVIVWFLKFMLKKINVRMRVENFNIINYYVY